MNKRSLWHLTLIMSTFVLLNTFVFDSKVKPIKETTSLADITIEHLPISVLKNEDGQSLCSCINLGDTSLTLSTKNLPSSLKKNLDTIHKIKSSDSGIVIYSDRISPTLDVAELIKEDESFIIVSNLDSLEPKISTAVWKEGKPTFLVDSPESDGIALKGSNTGFIFSGVWDKNNHKLKAALDVTDLSEILAANTIGGNQGKETFYCLENDQMQVVFSSRGGAIAEINLNLRSKTNHSSVVLPVAIDQKMALISPQNNLYPLHGCVGIDNSGNSIAIEKKEGGYMPLVRRDVIGKEGETLFKVPSSHYAMAFNGKDNLKVSDFTVTKFSANSISFKGQINGKDVTRSYHFVKDAPYVLEMKNSVNGYVESLSINSGIPEFEIDSGSAPPSLLYYNFNGKKMKLEAFKMPKDVTTKENITPDWVANTNGYFSLIVNPRGETAKGITTVKVEGVNCPSRAAFIGGDGKQVHKFPGYMILSPYKDTTLPTSTYLYAGPIDGPVLSKVDAALTNTITGSNPDFSKVNTVRGWLTFIADPFSKFMNAILDFFYMMTKSWGISIILLTITLRLLLYPFNAKAFKSMLKMKKIAPKQKAIEKEFKNDPARLRMELSMLFRNEGVNPLASILPLLLQIPFFIGMFDLLKTKFALRGAIFIPGWIDNLTAPDILFSWGFNIPFLGADFHLLPILGALSMHFSQVVTKKIQGPKKNPTDMEKQMEAMGPIMTLVFLFIFYNLASGLNIYLILSTLLGTFQQWYTQKRYSEKNTDIKVVKN